MGVRLQKTFLPKRFFKRARERFGKDGKEEFKGLETQITPYICTIRGCEKGEMRSIQTPDL